MNNTITLNRKRIFQLSVGVIGIVILSWLAGIVGGVSIRREGLGQLGFSVTSPLLPGVPFEVRWNPSETEDFPVLLRVRSASGLYDLVSSSYARGMMTAELPCTVSAEDATLQLQRADTGEVVTSQTVAVLAAGPDCL